MNDTRPFNLIISTNDGHQAGFGVHPKTGALRVAVRGLEGGWTYTFIEKEKASDTLDEVLEALDPRDDDER